MTTALDINLFYPLLFLVFIVLIVTIGLVIKGKSSDNTYTKVFTKSSDNAKDVTIKVTTDMKDMHHDVIEHALPTEYEKELHQIETTLKEISDTLTDLTNRIVQLEQQNQDK